MIMSNLGNHFIKRLKASIVSNKIFLKIKMILVAPIYYQKWVHIIQENFKENSKENPWEN